MKAYPWFARRLVAVLFLASTVFAVAVKAGELEVHFINVGQGDCTLVVFPSGKRLLVDCGSVGGGFDADRVREYIKGHLDPTNPRIDLLLITHPDQDHYNKLPELLGEVDDPLIKVSKVMYSGSKSEYDVAGMDTWLDSIPASRRIVITADNYNVYPAKKLPGFASDGVVILAANVDSDYSSANARSIVLKISLGEFDVMLAGDATRDTDEAILDLYQNNLDELDVEIWKAAHHGAFATATKTSVWADAVKPEVVVFSCLWEKKFGHPNRNLAALFKDHTIAADDHPIRMWESKNKESTETETKPYRTEAMYQTSANGDIVIKSTGQRVNGQLWTVTLKPTN